MIFWLLPLHLKPEKSKFTTSQVDYLGHTLTAEGVKPNESNIAAINEFAKPQSVKEVRTFLGLVNFYQQHVRIMATVSRPLTALTGRNLCGVLSVMKHLTRSNIF